MITSSKPCQPESDQLTATRCVFLFERVALKHCFGSSCSQYAALLHSLKRCAS